MSYILEALKKSDSERQQQPSSLPLKDLAPLASRKRTTNFSLLIPITILALLIGIGTTFWYHNSLQTPQTLQTMKKDPHVKAETTNSPTEVPAPETTKEIVLDVFEPAPIRHLPPIENALASTSENNTQSPSPYADVIHLRELPSDIQALIPPLKFAGHAYAKNPARRMIIINNKIVKEGDTIDNQLILKTITTKGVILSYKAMIFQIVFD